MFTGIVQQQCPVVAVEMHDGVMQLSVKLGQLAEGLELGASIAHNGVCLTAAAIDDGVVRVDVISETLEVTNLDSVKVGDRLNIERSLKFGDELGGHILSGHVAGTAKVDEIEADGRNRTMWFEIDPEHMPNLIWKGWVAVDGASLTISRVDRETSRIAVSLIPETLERTTLGRVQPGDLVNIELDAQTQTIVHTVREMFANDDFRQSVLDSVGPIPGAK